MKIDGNTFEIVKQAISDFSLIEKNDKILIGLSGGKDSIVLADILNKIKDEYKINIVCAHVTGSYDGKNLGLATEIVDYLKLNNIEYYEVPIMLEDSEELPLNCKRCSHNRRKTLFFTASKLNCNKIALAHNYEDISETIMMNIFTSGKLETLMPKRLYFDEFTLIRPLYYLSVKKVISYVKRYNLPVVKNECVLSETAARSDVRNMLNKLLEKYPNIFENINKLCN